MKIREIESESKRFKQNKNTVRSPAKKAIAAATRLFGQGVGKEEVFKNLEAVAAAPADFAGHELYGKFSSAEEGLAYVKKIVES